jgi:hypothetical protein
MYSRIGDPKKMGEDYVCPGNSYLLNKGSKTASISNVIHCEDA